MLLTKLKLNYFGRFQNKEIELKPGINLIYGENEAGKSTIHTFMKGMLFGIERMRGRGASSKEDLYTKFLPWDYPGAFGGQMDIMLGDKEYRLLRSFHANDKYFKVIDVETGREIKLKEGQINELIPGLSESTFKNTISIEQLKSHTDSELASQVRNYITNLSIAKSKEVNVAKAVSSLTDQKKVLESAQYETAIKNLLLEIEKGMELEERVDALTVELKKRLDDERELIGKKETCVVSIDSKVKDRMEELPAVLEKYHSYRDLTKQSMVLDRQLSELREKISLWEKGDDLSVSIKEDVRIAEQLRSELPVHERRQIEHQKESEEAIRSIRNKNLLVSTVPTFVMALLSFLILPSGLLKITVPAIVIVGGILYYAMSSKKCHRVINEHNQKQKDITDEIADSKKRLESILRKHQVTSIEELSLRREEYLKQAYSLENAKEQLQELINRKAEAEDKRDVLHDTIMKYMQFFITEEELSDEAIQRLQEIIRRMKQETADKQEELNHRLEANRLQIEKLRWEITSLEGNEERLLANKEKYEQLKERQKENAIELEAVKLALNTMKELSTDIHDSFGRQLNLAVSEVIGKVTGMRYNDLKVDEKLEVKVGWNGNYVILDRLSAGTIDQVYFALRIAVADLLLGKDDMPLILDDSFAFYDDNRIKAAIKEVAERKQILLFSCHNREQRILEEMELPYHFVDLSCR